MARRRMSSSLLLHRRLPTVPGLSAGLRAANRARVMARQSARRAAQLVRRRQGSKKQVKDHVGTFTKCWNKSVKRRNPYAARKFKHFAKKVRRVMDTDLTKDAVLVERGVQWNIGPSGDATKAARCGWMQLGLSCLNGSTYNQAWYDPNACSAANPAGLSTCLVNSTVAPDNAALDSGAFSTVFGAIQNRAGTSSVVPGFNNTRFRLEGRRMHMSLRNPQPFGYWLDIFYVRGRKPTSGKALDNPQAFGNVGLNYYTTTSPFMGSPLECMALGYSYTSTAGCQYHGLTKHASPQESRTFNTFWKITKKCRVYLPPGGTLEKALVQKSTRVMGSQYLSQFMTDHGTEYLLMRAVPEIQMTTTTGNWPGLPVKTGSTGTSLYGLVGDVAWRYTFRQVNDSGSYDTTAALAYQPVTTTLLAGQAEPVNKVV